MLLARIRFTQSVRIEDTERMLPIDPVTGWMSFTQSVRIEDTESQLEAHYWAHYAQFHSVGPDRGH